MVVCIEQQWTKKRSERSARRLGTPIPHFTARLSISFISSMRWTFRLFKHYLDCPPRFQKNWILRPKSKAYLSHQTWHIHVGHVPSSTLAFKEMAIFPRLIPPYYIANRMSWFHGEGQDQTDNLSTDLLFASYVLSGFFWVVFNVHRATRIRSACRGADRITSCGSRSRPCVVREREAGRRQLYRTIMLKSCSRHDSYGTLRIRVPLEEFSKRLHIELPFEFTICFVEEISVTLLI